MTRTLYTAEETMVAARDSAVGWISALWADGHLRRVTIGHSSRRAALAALDAGKVIPLGDEELAGEQFSLLERLQAAAAGDMVNFSDVKLDLRHLRPFARRVVERCRRIRPGQTMSYGELAAACGSPKAARAVGNVMRTNRFPLIVPCHRVIGSDGALGGFSAPTGVDLKRRMLEMEGSVGQLKVSRS